MKKSNFIERYCSYNGSEGFRQLIPIVDYKSLVKDFIEMVPNQTADYYLKTLMVNSAGRLDPKQIDNEIKKYK